MIQRPPRSTLFPSRRSSDLAWTLSANHHLCDQQQCYRCPCGEQHGDRKSTRLNSSHVKTSYAVFCLKKQRKAITEPTPYPILGRSRTAPLTQASSDATLPTI